MAGRPVKKGGPDAAAHREAARRWYQRLSRRKRDEYVARRDPEKQREADNRRYQKAQPLRDVERAKRADPERERARDKAKDIPLAKACEDCGRRTDLERHHPDHKNPTKVVTLCSRCNQRREKTYRGLRHD
jgi:hypothetical protein